MKKGITAALVVSLAIVGCSGTPQVEQTNDVERESQVVSEEVEEGPSFEETQQAVIDYLNSDETRMFSESNDYIHDLIEYCETRDGESADSAKDLVYALCNRVISRDDVPEPCEQLDSCLKKVAEYQKECAYYYAACANEEDYERAADYLEYGGESLREATRYLDEAATHVENVKEMYDIVTN